MAYLQIVSRGLSADKPQLHAGSAVISLLCLRQMQHPGYGMAWHLSCCAAGLLCSSVLSPDGEAAKPKGTNGYKCRAVCMTVGAEVTLREQIIQHTDEVTGSDGDVMSLSGTLEAMHSVDLAHPNVVQTYKSAQKAPTTVRPVPCCCHGMA